MARLYLTTSAALSLALVACSGDDQPPPAQSPPQVVHLRDVAEKAPKTTRYDSAELLVQISFTRGEKSRGAVRSVQTHVSVIDDDLFFSRTPHGAEGERVTRSAKLTSQQRASVEQAIADLELLGVESLTVRALPSGPHEFASASVKLRAGGAEHTFDLSGVTGLPDHRATAFSQTEGFRAIADFVARLERLSREGTPTDAPR